MTKKETNGLYKSLCYCTNLRRSALIISEYYDVQLRDSGLTASQYYLLINLSRLGSANITHWAQRVGLDRSTMVRNIRTLSAHELVELTQGAGKTYCLSDKGKQVLEQAVPLWEQAQQGLEAYLGQETAQTILRVGGLLQEWKQSAIGNETE